MKVLRLRNRGFWLVAIVSIAIDHLTKYWISQQFDLLETLALLPGVFHFTYVTNPGAAFSLFAGSGWLKWLSLIVSLGLIAYGLRSPRLSRLEQFAYGAILGGAIGNGIDRFLWGEVNDFLDFRLINFPIFNLADVSINLGLIALLWLAFQPVARASAAASASPPERRNPRNHH